MRKKLAALAAAVLSLQLTASAASALTVGGQTTFHGTPMPSQGGTIYNMETTTGETPSVAEAYSDAWNTLDASSVYRTWESYEVPGGSNEWTPTHDPNWENTYNYGFFPVTTYYNVPISNLQNELNRWISFFPACDGGGAFTMMHPDSPLFNSRNINNVRNIGAQEFFYGTDKFRLGGDKSYDSLSEMYNDSNDEEKKIIENLLRDALKKIGIYSDQKIDEMINALKNTANNVSGSLTALIDTGIGNAIRGLLSGLSDEQKYQLMKLWMEAHQGTFDENNPPFIFSTSGMPYINPFFVDGSYIDLPDNGGVFNVIPYTYYLLNNKPSDWEDVHFSDEIVNGGVYDATYMHHRLRLAEHILNAYNNMGVQTVDITKVLDYRITSLWVGAEQRKEPTGRYIWTIEKQDSDGKYTLISDTQNNPAKQGIDFSFRPSSAGRYRITCYPQYTSSTCNKIAVYATQYSFLSDTKNVLFSEQFFEKGDTYACIDEVMDTSISSPMWNEGIDDAQDAVTLYKNEHATFWELDVTDAMIGKDIINLDNGTVRSDFDTERIK